jgi:hypothetical protein
VYTNGISSTVTFVPVLIKMGLKGVKFTGGSTEYGIDVEYYELTQPENNRSYVGIQFKKGNLTYSSRGSKGTVKEVKNQAEEAFDKEIHDLEGRSLGYNGRIIVAVLVKLMSKHGPILAGLGKKEMTVG